MIPSSNDLEKMGILIVAKKNVFDYLCVVLCTLQDGWSALMTASQHGHYEIVKVLIERGANINSQNKVSMTVDKITTVVSRKRAHGRYTLVCAHSGVGGYL